MKKAYDITTNRVIVLDFNGTIVLKEPPGKYLKREILGFSGYKPPASVSFISFCSGCYGQNFFVD